MRLSPPVPALLLALFSGVNATLPADAKEPLMQTQLKSPQSPFGAQLQPLADAVASGNLPAIAALATPASLAQTGQDGVTLLEWAIWNQQADALSALLAAGADPAAIGMDAETVAHLAASVDDPRYLQILIAHAAPVDQPGARAGRTPLFAAVQGRRAVQVTLLLDAGADINRADSMGDTPVHVAAQVNDAACVLLLLQRGADPTARNRRGATFTDALMAGSDARLSAQGRSERQAVRDWLTANLQAH
jgi:ankyrin repeat protein